MISAEKMRMAISAGLGADVVSAPTRPAFGSSEFFSGMGEFVAKSLVILAPVIIVGTIIVIGIGNSDRSEDRRMN